MTSGERFLYCIHILDQLQGLELDRAIKELKKMATRKACGE